MAKRTNKRAASESSDTVLAAVAAVVLWGLGASLGFPLALSAAGEGGGDPARRVAFAATVGYVALLVGPPVIGFLGEHSGLRTALIAPLVLVVGAVFITPVVRPLETSTSRAGLPSRERAAGR